MSVLKSRLQPLAQKDDHRPTIANSLLSNFNEHCSICQLPAGVYLVLKAVKLGHRHIVRLLLDHGVNVAAIATGRRSALTIARQQENKPVIELLGSHMTK